MQYFRPNKDTYLAAVIVQAHMNPDFNKDNIYGDGNSGTIHNYDLQLFITLGQLDWLISLGIEVEVTRIGIFIYNVKKYNGWSFPEYHDDHNQRIEPPAVYRCVNCDEILGKSFLKDREDGASYCSYDCAETDGKDWATK